MLKFESKKEKYLFLGIAILLMILISVVAYPSIKTQISKVSNQNVEKDNLDISSNKNLTSEDYYAMFQCPCCGKPIDSNCCGMAKARKDYVDNLILKGLNKEEIMYQMVKKFGFETLMDQSKEQEIKEYMKNKAPSNPAEISINETIFDFGVIKQTEGVVATIFDIKNTGKSDLIIDNLDTSCMCTSASLIYKGKEGPRFGMSMHGSNPENYKLIIPPGELVKLKVYYDPMAHGKQKKSEMKITREVTISSNDPVDFQKKVKIELTQIQQ